LNKTLGWNWPLPDLLTTEDTESTERAQAGFPSLATEKSLTEPLTDVRDLRFEEIVPQLDDPRRRRGDGRPSQIAKS